MCIFILNKVKVYLQYLLHFRPQPTSARDGAAHYLPQEAVLQHQEQQEEGGQDSWWQAGIPGTTLFLF